MARIDRPRTAQLVGLALIMVLLGCGRTIPSGPDIAGIRPFVGTWQGHARMLTVASDGGAQYHGRVFQWCEAGGLPPCDRKGDVIIGGLDERLVFSRVSGETAYGIIASGTSDLVRSRRLPLGTQIAITLARDDKLAVSDGWTLCGSRTPPTDPACSGS